MSHGEDQGHIHGAQKSIHGISWTVQIQIRCYKCQTPQGGLQEEILSRFRFQNLSPKILWRHLESHTHCQTQNLRMAGSCMDRFYLPARSLQVAQLQHEAVTAKRGLSLPQCATMPPLRVLSKNSYSEFHENIFSSKLS